MASRSSSLFFVPVVGLGLVLSGCHRTGVASSPKMANADMAINEAAYDATLNEVANYEVAADNSTGNTVINADASADDGGTFSDSDAQPNGLLPERPNTP